ncbi:MAG: hypothetical protein N2Z22_03445 [Turneriella sp.]|nr:hypothetical protein [Turneriella sp.]
MHWRYTIAIVLWLFSCTGSTWREGFISDNRLHLVGEGHAREDLPEIQKQAMAKEAAVLDAYSHWPRFCPQGNPVQFRIENQKERLAECSGGHCRVRIVIEKDGLRQHCQS